MPVSINITGENATEAVKELSCLASHFISATSATSGPVEGTQEKTKRQRAAKQDKAEETPQQQSEPVSEGKLSVETTPETETETDAEEGGEENVPTVVELREKAQEVGKTDKGKGAIKALLVQFDCKSISNVPEEKRADFLKALEALSL